MLRDANTFDDPLMLSRTDHLHCTLGAILAGCPTAQELSGVEMGKCIYDSSALPTLTVFCEFM